MKQKKTKSAFRRKLSKAVSAAVLAMFAVCLIYTFFHKEDEVQPESVFDKKVNELVKEQYPDAEIVFRAAPVAYTYGQMPDEKVFEYKICETLHDALIRQSQDESTNALLLELQTKMADLKARIDTTHGDDDIRYRVQKIRFTVGDSLMVHAFAKLSPDYKECELQVGSIESLSKLHADQTENLEKELDSIQSQIEKFRNIAAEDEL